MKYCQAIRKTMLLVGGIVIMSGCVSSGANHPGRDVTGSNVGEIKILSMEKDLVSISLSKKYMASLYQSEMFEQKVCAGEYVLGARSIIKVPTKDNRVVRIQGSLPIQVKRNQTQYYLVAKNNNGWEFKSLSQAEWQNYSVKKESNARLERRLPDSFVQCK